MARADNSYSRFVNWVKILLPVAALAILSSLFLIQPEGEGAQTLPFSEVELAQLARGQGIGGPNYTGVTADGRSLTLQADSAFPRLGNRRVVDARTVRAVLATEAHGDIRLAAKAATVDQDAALADLTGGVLVETDTGYRVVSEHIRTALDRTDLETQTPATVTGPGLRIDAGAIVLTADPKAPDATIVVFKDGVKLLYDPQQR